MSKLEELPAKNDAGPAPAPAETGESAKPEEMRPICPHCGADPLELALRQEGRQIGFDQIRTHIYFCQKCRRPVPSCYTVQIVPPQVNPAVHVPPNGRTGPFRMPHRH
jgi:hypothetical protein